MEPDRPALQLVPETQADFDSFWLLYPRKVARKDAKVAWGRLGPEERVAAIVALVGWRRVWSLRGELDYVPHPASWLNGERWTDELPAEITATASSHLPFAPAATAEPFVRGALPQVALDAIAKLRGRR